MTTTNPALRSPYPPYVSPDGYAVRPRQVDVLACRLLALVHGPAATWGPYTPQGTVHWLRLAEQVLDDLHRCRPQPGDPYVAPRPPDVPPPPPAQATVPGVRTEAKPPPVTPHKIDGGVILARFDTPQAVLDDLRRRYEQAAQDSGRGEVLRPGGRPCTGRRTPRHRAETRTLWERLWQRSSWPEHSSGARPARNRGGSPTVPVGSPRNGRAGGVGGSADRDRARRTPGDHGHEHASDRSVSDRSDAAGLPLQFR